MWEQFDVAVRSIMQATLAAGALGLVIWMALQPFLDAIDSLRFL